MNLSILEKIRKLRTLASGTTNLHEADVAARQAARMVEKHRLDEAEVEAFCDGAHNPDAAKHDREAVLAGGSLPGWKRTIVHVCSEHFGCVVLISRRAARGRPGHFERYMTLVGRPSDVALVRELVALLTVQVATLCNATCKGRGRTWRSSWSLGCAQGLGDQLELGRREAQQGASTTALARVEARKEEAERLLPPDIRREKRTSYYQPRAYDVGRAVGRAMPIALPGRHAMGEGSS